MHSCVAPIQIEGVCKAMKPKMLRRREQKQQQQETKTKIPTTMTQTPRSQIK